jgi:hypothetical protein
MRMKTRSRLADPWLILGRKRGPFNRPMSPSLLRDDPLEADLSGYGDRNPAPGFRFAAFSLRKPLPTLDRVRGAKTRQTAAIATEHANP